MSEKKAKLLKFVEEMREVIRIVCHEIIRSQYDGSNRELAEIGGKALEWKKYIHNLSVVLKWRAKNEGFRQANFVGKLLEHLKEAENVISNVTPETSEQVVAWRLAPSMFDGTDEIFNELAVSLGKESVRGLKGLAYNDPKIIAATEQIISEHVLDDDVDDDDFDPESTETSFAEMYPERGLEGGVKRKQKLYRRKSIRSKRRSSRKSKRRNSRCKN
jgi:hypothetical protein